MYIIHSTAKSHFVYYMNCTPDKPPGHNNAKLLRNCGVEKQREFPMQTL